MAKYNKKKLIFFPTKDVVANKDSNKLNILISRLRSDPITLNLGTWKVNEIIFKLNSFMILLIFTRG